MANSDRISEVYKGEIWAESTQQIARDRIHWLVGQATGDVLDIGCSQGIASLLCARRGLTVVGIDIQADRIEYARGERENEPADVRERLDFRLADGGALDFPDGSFDTVIMGEIVEHSEDASPLLAEAARVLRPGGRLVASLFAAPERSQGTVAHEAMTALIPPERAADHAPYALSAPGNLEASLVSVGLTLDASGEVVCHWRYADIDEAVRALLCSAGGARAAEAAGRDAVRDALRPPLAQFQDQRTGAVSLRNTFRWVAARR
jgi:SAM-dependent methyltransferase